jgi:hypothetical protein
MLSARLVALIEEHAEELTRGLLDDLQTNPRTPEYHRLPRSVVYDRLHEVYCDLSEWLGHEADEILEAHYLELAKARCADTIPLSEVIYALTLTKYHLREYIRNSGLTNSAVELYQQQELHRLVGDFFDKAVYYTAKGYEHEARMADLPSELAEKV